MALTLGAPAPQARSYLEIQIRHRLRTESASARRAALPIFNFEIASNIFRVAPRAAAAMLGE
jgi:hypothetical protein